LVDSFCSVVSHTYAAKNNYPVSVTVTDSDGDTAQAFLAMQVLNRPPETPTLIAEPTSGFAPVLVWITASSTDPDGDPIIGWEFDFDDPNSPGNVSTNCVTDASCHRVDHVFNARPGEATSIFNVRGRASDSDGDWSDWGLVQVTVKNSYSISVFDVNDLIRGSDLLHIDLECIRSDNLIETNLDIEISIYNSEDVRIYNKLFNQCVDVHEIINPAIFLKESIYHATASIDGKPCRDCPETDYIAVKNADPEVSAPETNLVAIVLVAFAVLVIAGRKEDKIS